MYRKSIIKWYRPIRAGTKTGASKGAGWMVTCKPMLSWDWKKRPVGTMRVMWRVIGSRWFRCSNGMVNNLKEE